MPSVSSVDGRRPLHNAKIYPKQGQIGHYSAKVYDELEE